MRGRRHRSHRRSALRRLRHSLRGVGIALLLSLLVASALVYAVLPAAEIFGFLWTVPDAHTLAEMERKANARGER